MSKALTKTNVAFSLSPTTLQDAMQLADIMAKSDFVPKDYKNKPGNVLVAVQMGAEVGLSPMQSIQNIAVINGRPCVWGDSMLAIAQGHPDFEDIEESCDGEAATCTVKRKGRSPTVRTFSKADAKKAGLLNKQGPWSQYTERMLQMRARSFALRDAFADALRGINSAEEVSDYQEPVKIETREVKEGRHSMKRKPEPVDAEVVEEKPRPTIEELVAEVDAAETLEEARAVYAKATNGMGYKPDELGPVIDAGRLRAAAIKARDVLADEGPPSQTADVAAEYVGASETQDEFGF